MAAGREIGEANDPPNPGLPSSEAPRRVAGRVSAPTDDVCMERRWQPSTPWDSQEITNGLEVREPDHTLSPPVPIVATIRWAVDGEEHIDTEAVGWTGQAVYVRVADPRCRTNAIWLDGADVQPR
jgi:hypothetical protein